MSLFSYLQGTLVATSSIRLRGNGYPGPQLPAAADGTGSQGAVVFDDPTGSLTVTGWQTYIAEEPDCASARRLFTGLVADRTYRRGPYLVDAGREIDTTINDQNIYLSMRLITGSDAKRPEETDTARLAWLLGSDYLDGLVYDTGWVTGAGRTFDATDYHGQYPADVLYDLAGPRGQIFYAAWDHSVNRVGLFFDAPDSTTNTSSLTISNVLTDVTRDVNGIVTGTCYPPSKDGELQSDPSDVYSHIRYKYTGGAVYANNPTTAATFFPSPLLRRGINVENDRVGKRTTATTFANRILARDSVEHVTITCTVRLPSTKVGLIDAGQRISVRFSHLPGFTSFAWTRVERKVVSQTEGDPTNYDVVLTLSTYGIRGGGGTGTGSTDNFPVGPPQEAVHWWSDGFTVVGDNLVGDPAGESPTTTVLVADQVYTYHISVTWDAISYAHVLQLGIAPGVLDFDFTDMPDGAGSYTFDGTFTAPDAGHLNNPYHLFGAAAQAPHGHDVVGTVSFWVDPPDWITGAGAAEASPGNPVEDETPTPDPDGVETVFTTLYPFAPGSLHVDMNGVELDSGVDFTETTSTTFTFTDPPPTNAQIVVWYIAGS